MEELTFICWWGGRHSHTLEGRGHSPPTYLLFGAVNWFSHQCLTSLLFCYATGPLARNKLTGYVSSWHSTEQTAPSLMPRSQMHPDEFPMCSRWVFWQNRPAALGCPAGRRVDGHACLKAMCFYWLWRVERLVCRSSRRVKIRRRERHRELLTRSYNFPDVESLFGHRINILRWPAGGRPAIGDILRRPDWYRVDRANPEYLRHPSDHRPMICRRPADDLPAPGRFPADYLASDATLWHIGQPPAGRRCDVGYNQCDVTPTIGLYYEVRT